VELTTRRRNREGCVGHAHRGVLTEVVGEIRLHVENIHRLQTVLARRGDRSVDAATVTRELGGDPEVLVRQARDDVTDGRSVLDVAGRDNDSRIGLHVFPFVTKTLRIELPFTWGLIQCTTGFDPHKSCGAIFSKILVAVLGTELGVRGNSLGGDVQGLGDIGIGLRHRSQEHGFDLSDLLLGQITLAVSKRGHERLAQTERHHRLVQVNRTLRDGQHKSETVAQNGATARICSHQSGDHVFLASKVVRSGLNQVSKLLAVGVDTEELVCIGSHLGSFTLLARN